MNTITDGCQPGKHMFRDTFPLLSCHRLGLVVKERPVAVRCNGFASQQRSACHACANTRAAGCALDNDTQTRRTLTFTIAPILSRRKRIVFTSACASVVLTRAKRRKLSTST